MSGDRGRRARPASPPAGPSSRREPARHPSARPRHGRARGLARPRVRRRERVRSGRRGDERGRRAGRLGRLARGSARPSPHGDRALRRRGRSARGGGLAGPTCAFRPPSGAGCVQRRNCRSSSSTRSATAGSEPNLGHAGEPAGSDVSSFSRRSSAAAPCSTEKRSSSPSRSTATLSPGSTLPVEHHPRELVLDQALDCAPERPRAELAVVALSREQLDRLVA